MRVLFAGLGSIGQRHLRNLERLLGDELEVHAYRRRHLDVVLTDDMKVEEGRRLADRYGLCEHENLDEALATRPDAVFVTNPNSMHLEVALAAARAGCHLFIEKPLSNDEEGLDELEAEVARQGIVAFVAYQQRFHPGFARMSRWLAEGRVGSVVSAHLENGEYLPDWHPWEDYRSSHPGRADLGGGALVTQIHDLDMAVALFGMPERLFAAGGRLSGLDVDVEDAATVLLSYPRDGGSLPVVVQLDYVQWPPARSTTVVGDAGRIEWDLAGGTLTLFDRHSRASQTERFEGYARNDMFVAELEHFLACIRGEAEPLVDLAEARRSLRLAASARQSLGSGRAVAP